ncbi:uncharacterized protein DNG_08017 [Cephalotrichum gorgonifer]|uniref:Uncharacterized protein n=1 Tax=Cephalotrichum gorgonifer TaxID=2041049 RepID=A0AAE8N2Y5_9PEZI|nr:uncharacterized protein DNG_08017 [Cephalotrichum gorgonifer]
MVGPAPKVWFVLPSLIYKPDDYIQLGQIVTNPRKPQERLAKPLPLPEALKPRTSPSSDWNLAQTGSGETAISVSTHVINILTAQLSNSKTGGATLSRTAAKLETQYFEIAEDPSYVSSTSQVKQVEDALKKLGKLGSTVYMITGIQIALFPGEAADGTSDESTVAAKIEGVVDPQGWAKAGGEASSKKSDATTVSQTPDTSYIVAYRLRRLRVGWRGKLKVGDDQGGADMYCVGGRSAVADGATRDEDNNDNCEIESILPDPCDFGASLPPIDVKLEAVDEDGSPCLVIKAER